MKFKIVTVISLMLAGLCGVAPVLASTADEIAKNLSREDRELLLRDEAAFLDKAESEGVTMANGTFMRLFGQWILKIQKAESGGRYVLLEHMNEVGKPVNLSIRCLDNKTSVLLGINQSFPAPAAPLEYRIDGGKTVKTEADVSAQGLHLFVRRAVPFLRTLAGKKSLSLRLYPEAGGVVEDVLDIRGIEDVLEPIEQACNWKLKR